MDINTILNNSVIAYAPKIIFGIIALIVGFWIINFFTKTLKKGFEKRKMEVSLSKFLGSLTSITLKILLLITIVSTLGVEMTSFIAIIGAAGLAVGLALQGSLANFAGGVLILLFKPFRIGDFIDAQGHSGTVSQIEVFNTTLKTPDNKTVIIPNGSLSNGSITNFSTEDTRRVDLVFGIGYGNDIKKAEKILKEIVSKEKQVLKNPESFVRVGELADSSVNFTVRLWCKKKIIGMFISICTNKSKLNLIKQKSAYHSHKWMCGLRSKSLF